MLAILAVWAAQIVPQDDRWEVDLNITHAFNRRLAPGWQPYLVTAANTGQRELDLTLVARQKDSNVKITRRRSSGILWKLVIPARLAMVGSDL